MPADLVERAPESALRGPVFLVGAGPGDPELLTIKAVKRLESAEVVLHDNLISDEVLALVPATSELVNVGKRCGDVKDRGLQQQEIHELMLLHSRRGRRVVRLKCGDPFVFGRGGEELEFLAAHDVPVEVVPGITTALGAAASCQVPLTHRCFGANQIRFVVGQSQARRLPDLDWAELANAAGTQTIAIYMGFKMLTSICGRLRENGAAGDIPIALVENATTPQERALYSTLEAMPELARKQEAGADGGPVLLLVGRTARFPVHLEELVAGASGQRPRKRARPESVDEC